MRFARLSVVRYAEFNPLQRDISGRWALDRHRIAWFETASRRAATYSIKYVLYPGMPMLAPSKGTSCYLKALRWRRRLARAADGDAGA
jgi:hypothetical protein